MVNGYVENLLKRNLKKKVKVTLSLLVTFLITGTALLANTPNIENEGEYLSKNYLEYIKEAQKYSEDGKNWKENLEKYNEYFAGLTLEATDVNEIREAREKNSVAINTDIQTGKLGDIFVYDEGTSQKPKKYYTYQIAENEGIIINKGTIQINGSNYQIGQFANNSKAYNYGNIVLEIVGRGQEGIDKSVLYNFGEINSIWTPQIVTNESVAYNYGYLYGRQTQTAMNNSEIYNYGIVNAPSYEGLLLQNSSLGKNYGLLIAENGQTIQSNSSGYNYGEINSKNNGQAINNALGYNYGIIKAGEGQIINNNGKGYNYGLIINTKGNGQQIYTGKAGYNYGVIINEGADGQNAINGNAYNYGLIVNEGENAMSAQTKSYNYGLIINEKEGQNIFSTTTISGTNKGNIDNKGIAIYKGTNTNINEFNFLSNTNYGVIVNENFELLDGNDKVEKISSEVSNSSLTKIGFIKNSTAEITEDLANKSLTAIVNENIDNAVFYKNGNLTLTDTSIVGYFENNGALLKVNGDLTLEGNSIINAISANEYTGYNGNELNVVAVRLNDNSTLKISENSKVIGKVLGSGRTIFENNNENHLNGYEVDSMEIKTTSDNTTNITLANVTLKDSKTAVENAGKLVIDNQSSKELENKKVSTSITLTNNIDIEKGIDGSSSTNGFELILGDGQISSDDTIKIGGEILLGKSDDTLVINNNLKEIGEINGNTGNDTVILKNLNGKHDTFNYQLKNIDTLDLNNQSWKIGENASIEFGNSDTTTKANEKTTIQNGTLMGELQGNIGNGVEFVNNDKVNNILGNSTFGDNAKFQIVIGKDMELEAGAEYNIADETINNLENIGEDKITASGIFTKATEDNSKEIRVKTAEEMKINERYSGIYDEMLKNASSNDEILNILNSSDVSNITNVINGKGALGDTLATTGYKITRDISNHFISSVNEWDKKAGKGEWLTNAKYINSDMEYDGANSVKGYDSDINSMVGMIEYGVSEKTAYGIALGGGDTEIDVDNAGTLKGDNYYIGAYVKHSVNGFDLVGNIGYTISELEVNGEGSADSTAITFGGYVKRDVKLTDTVKLEPNLSFTYDYIMQDNAEGNGVKVDNKDIHVFEASAGMNIVKEFAFETGKLDLKAGVKYSMADVNQNEEVIVRVFGSDNDINLGNPEIDDTKGTAHVGFDYEHETGFGFNGKYEMMWSNSGDDSRITAGISYRF